MNIECVMIDLARSYALVYPTWKMYLAVLEYCLNDKV